MYHLGRGDLLVCVNVTKLVDREEELHGSVDVTHQEARKELCVSPSSRCPPILLLVRAGTAAAARVRRAAGRPEVYVVDDERPAAYMRARGRAWMNWAGSRCHMVSAMVSDQRRIMAR